MKGDSTVEKAAARAARSRDASLEGRPDFQRTRGIVHTPTALARFVASEADGRLRRAFSMRSGLADERVSIVDPASGPGAFLAACLTVAGRRRSSPAGVWGMDLDSDALIEARAVLERPASRAGWRLALEERDTLSSWVGDDEAPPLETVVVIGNPPWAGRSANRGAARVGALLEDFRRDEEGVRLRERKLGVLSDDYVRFLRWGSEIVRRAPGGGVLAMVTNGSFLDGPVHRGMRAALMRWFTAIDVLDLGGNALVARDGGRDDNVFGVRPSVAVTIAHRLPAHDEQAGRGRVRFARVRGSAEAKLRSLESAPAYATIEPRSPHWNFAGGRPARWDAALNWVGLEEAMPFHAEGVQTNRDAAVVAPDSATLLSRLEAFASGAEDPALASVRRPRAHYDPEAARRAVAAALETDPEGRLSSTLRPLAYRPFDERVFAPIVPFCHRPRPKLLAAMDASAWALLTVRKDRGERPWVHFGATRAVPDNCWLSNRSSCRTRAFPMRRPDGSANLSPVVAGRFEAALGVEVGVEDFAHFALAILASASYREAYDAALKLDYPRIPIPTDADLFERFVQVGVRLREAFDAPLSEEGARMTLGHSALQGIPRALVLGAAAADECFAELLAPDPGR